MKNEPVAWKYKVNKNNTKTEGICTDKHYLEKDGIYDIEPLYTHPAKTLTDEEIIDCIDESEPDTTDMIRFARAILRKAQEK